MDPVVELPDAELVLVTALTARLPDYHVTWDPPLGSAFDDMLADMPIVDVTRIGGAVKYRKSWDEPVIDFDVYALSKDDASDAMKVVRAEIEALKASAQTLAVIAQVIEEIGPTRRPESNPAVTRLGCTYRFLLRNP